MGQRRKMLGQTVGKVSQETAGFVPHHVKTLVVPPRHVYIETQVTTSASRETYSVGSVHTTFILTILSLLQRVRHRVGEYRHWNHQCHGMELLMLMTARSGDAKRP
jgi:hypothetical protein